MVRMRLQTLKVVKTVLILHQDGKPIFTFIVEEMFFTTFQNIVYAFEGYCQHFDILHFEDRAQSCDDSFIN